jgi:hypothetical protein
MIEGYQLQKVAADPIGGWLVFTLLVAAAIGIGAWAYWATPAPLPRRRRVILWVCRATGLILLVLLLARPVAVLARQLGHDPEVVVLVDRSGSMGLRDSGADATRLARAARHARTLVADLSKRFRVTVRSFDTALHDPEADVASLVPDSARGSAPGEVLERLLREPSHPSLAAVVMLTDGVATRGHDLVSVAKRFPVPIYTLAIGDSAAPADVQLLGADAPPAAFVGEPTVVRVRARATGKTAHVARVRLAGPTGPIDEREVSLGGEGTLREIPFRIVPQQPGQQLYRLAVSAASGGRPAGDAIAVNDSLQFSLNVRKDRMQVLVLEERVTWDFTFLRRTLERDTTLAYNYLVRSPSGQPISLDDASVAEFPTTLETLGEYKAVILGDIDRDFLSTAQLELLARFVEAGGGLLILGGNRPEGLARFAGTPIERISPIDPSAPPAGGEGSGDASALAPRVTPLGDAHPLVALHGDVYQNRTVWADLPPTWPACAPASAGLGAQVLVNLEGPMRSFPLVTVGRAGGGRVMVFSGQAFWKWKFLRDGLGGRDEFFDGFWVGVMRWLADPDPTGRFWIQPERYVSRQGEDVELVGRAIGEDFQPLRDAALRCVIQAGGDSIEIAPSWGASGEVSFDADVLPPGSYTYRVTLDPARGAPAVERGGFIVDANGPEWWALAARPRLLAEAAEASGGAAIAPADIDALAGKIPTAPRIASVSHEIPLWNNPLPFLLFLLLVGVEWWVRRQSGLA